MILPTAIAGVAALVAAVLPIGPALVARVLGLAPTGWMLGTQLSSLAEFGIASSVGGIAGTAVVGLAAAAPLLVGSSGAPSRPARRPGRLLVPLLTAALAVCLTVAGTFHTLNADEAVQESVRAHVDASTGDTTWEVSGSTAWGRALDGTSGTTSASWMRVGTTTGPGAAGGRIRMELATSREGSELEIRPGQGGLSDVSIDGAPVEAPDPLKAIRVAGPDPGQVVVVEGNLQPGSDLTVVETVFDPTLAGGWTQPGDDVSLMQPRVEITHRVTP